MLRTTPFKGAVLVSGATTKLRNDGRRWGGFVRLAALLGVSSVMAPVWAGDAQEAPTTAECELIGRQIEETINQRDPSYLNEVFDLKATFDFAVHDLPARPEVLQVAVATFIDSYNVAQDSVLLILGEQGTLRFLRSKAGKNGQRLLFRAITGPMSFTYFEFLMTQGDNHIPKIVDVFTYSAGARLSETIRSGIVPVLRLEPEQVERLDAIDQSFVAHRRDYRAFVEIAGTGDYASAFAAFDRLPKILQDYRPLLIMRLSVLQQSDLNEYLRMLPELARRFPNDPVIKIMQLDYLMSSRDYAAALKLIDWIDRRVGGDPYLIVRRGMMAALVGKTDEAMSLYDRAIAVEPDLIRAAYPGLVRISLDRRDFSKTAAVLERMLDFPDTDPIEQILQKPAYAEFAKSPECAALLHRMKSRQVAEP